MAGKKQKDQKTAMVFSSIEEEAGIIRSFLEGHQIFMKEWNRTGASWASKWQTLKPSIVFVDYIMPRRDGFYVLKSLSRLESTQFAVFMHSYSGLAASDLELRALQAGAKAVIQKPLTENKLRVVIERFLAKEKEGPAKKIAGPS